MKVLMEYAGTYVIGLIGLEMHVMNFLCAILIMNCFLGKSMKLTPRRILAYHGALFAMILYDVIGCVALVLTPNEDGVRAVNVTYLIYAYATVLSVFFFREKRLLWAIETGIAALLFSAYADAIVLNIFGIACGNPALLHNMSVSGSFNTIFFLYVLSELMLVASIFFITYFGIYKKEIYLRLKVHEVIFLILWVVLAMFYGGLVTGTYKDEVRQISVMLLIPLLSIILPVLLLINRYRNYLREKNAYQQTYLDAELAYVRQYKKSQTQTAAFRHDVINQLSLLSMLMHSGATDKASEQLDQLLGNVKNLSPKYVTGDEMLDCIIAMKAADMEEKGIAFTQDGVVDGGLGMKPMDVCSVFANALDNAMEAAEKVKANSEENNQKWIKFQIKRTEKFFVFQISNATEGMVNVERIFEKGYTSKKHAELHGFGISNVRAVVEKYDGLLKAESKEGSFLLSVMIPRNKN